MYLPAIEKDDRVGSFGDQLGISDRDGRASGRPTRRELGALQWRIEIEYAHQPNCRLKTRTCSDDLYVTCVAYGPTQMRPEAVLGGKPPVMPIAAVDQPCFDAHFHPCCPRYSFNTRAEHPLNVRVMRRINVQGRQTRWPLYSCNRPLRRRRRRIAREIGGDGAAPC
jgi:hypothetical protein